MVDGKSAWSSDALALSSWVARKKIDRTSSKSTGSICRPSRRGTVGNGDDEGKGTTSADSRIDLLNKILYRSLQT